jgi:hypothetical protein
MSLGDWCAGYVNTYIERDVRQLIAVRYGAIYLHFSVS